MSSPNGGHGRDRDDAAPKFDHLLQLTDRRGTVDHAALRAVTRRRRATVSVNNVDNVPTRGVY